MKDTGIVRNRMKITAAINNAQALTQLEAKYGSFADFLRRFIPEPIINHPESFSDIPSKDQHSTEIAKSLKKLGFKFIGPITVYSFLQAIGLINDHLE